MVKWPQFFIMHHPSFPNFIVNLQRFIDYEQQLLSV